MRRATAEGWLVAVVAAALVAGCTTVVPQPVLIREPPPEPVPLVIGVHYSDDFRSFVYRWSWALQFVLGEPSVKLLDEALTLLFSRVVQVSGLPPRVSGGNEVAGVIEPRITAVSYSLKSYSQPPFGEVRITYAFTLYSREGVQLVSWQVSGRGAQTLRDGIIGFEKRILEQAMREAAWKLTSEFRGVPGVRRWLDEHGVTVSR